MRTPLRALTALFVGATLALTGAVTATAPSPTAGPG